MIVSLLCADLPKQIFINTPVVPRIGERIDVDLDIEREDRSYTFEITSVTYIVENPDSEEKPTIDLCQVGMTADLVYSSSHDIKFTQIKCHDGKFQKGFDNYCKGNPKPENDRIEQNGWECAKNAADLLNQIEEIKKVKIEESRKDLP
jgi:hypothetical protein